MAALNEYNFNEWVVAKIQNLQHRLNDVCVELEKLKGRTLKETMEGERDGLGKESGGHEGAH